MNIAIIEDLKTDLDAISKTVRAYYEEQKTYTQFHPFASGEDFLKTYQPNRYDLIFLDIYMDGMNGMDVARILRKNGDTCSIVFITSSDAFAVSSYDVRASYYLLKPYAPAKLKQILGSIEIKKAQESRYLEIISDRIPVQVPFCSILYADTWQNAVQVHTKAGIIRSYIPFHKFQEMLAEDSRFLSCYRGCIINMDHIAQSMDNGFVMDNQEFVAFRKRGSKRIRQQYMQYLFETKDQATS